MKKNIFLLAFAMIALAACEKNDEVMNEPTGKVLTTFAVTGDFEVPTFSGMTRAVTADGKAMTDLWVLDYAGGLLVQQLHQTAEDEDFGSPAMALDFGQHHVYFVCSRGKTPALSTDGHIICWGSPSDTFYKDFSVNVTAGASATHNVTLQRVATRLSVTINDELPSGLSTVDIVPDTWHYAIDYLTGLPTGAQTAEPLTISIPASYAGRTNTTLSIYGLSGATEWTTDVTITARDGEDDILGQATISGAPFVANRVTNYSGNLFCSNSGFAMTLNDAWDDAVSGEW